MTTPGYPAAAPRTNGLAIAALVLGIISLISFCIWFISVPLGIVAVVLGILGVRKTRDGYRQGGMAKAGIILGAIGAVISIVATVAGLSFISSKADDFQACATLTSESEQEACVQSILTNR